MIQFILTPSAGKRLIAKALTKFLEKQTALRSGNVVIVAGTTNGYIAEELLTLLGQGEGFNRKRFFRGITTAPNVKTTETGRLPDEAQFPGDVVLQSGVWQRGKTIFDVVDTLCAGDIIVKGVNCVDVNRKKAGILIGHPEGGTTLAIIKAVIGKRVRLIIPVGLEKRITEDIDIIATRMNSPESTGPRMMPVSGQIITEIEAVELLTGANATLVAAGGVCGAEGCVWLIVDGDEEQIKRSYELLNSVENEPQFLL